jgi:hypothetical protein
VIIVLVPRALLSPFPLIVFTANFLPDRRISHVEEPKDQTPQVRQVGNPTPSPGPGSVKLQETKDDYHVFGGDREEEID